MLQHLFPFALSKKMIFNLGINIRWGMTKSDVKRSETLEIYKEDKGSIYYKDKSFGHEVGISYNFHNNELYQAIYVLNKFSRNEEVVNAYRKIIAALIDKYGKPYYRTFSDTDWRIGNTEIYAWLGNGNIAGIMYSNIKMKKEAEEAREKEKLSKRI